MADQSLLAVELGELFHGGQIVGIELDDLLIHRNRFQQAAVGGIGFGDDAETLDRLFVLAEAGIDIAHGIEDGEISRFDLEDLAVFGDGVCSLFCCKYRSAFARDFSLL